MLSTYLWAWELEISAELIYGVNYWAQLQLIAQEDFFFFASLEKML